MEQTEKNYTVWHPVGGILNHKCSLTDHEYQLVGNVTASTKERAFIHSQSFSSQWEKRNLRSTSIGDIISDGDNYYMVKGMGFKQILPLTRLHILKEVKEEPVRDLVG